MLRQVKILRKTNLLQLALIICTFTTLQDFFSINYDHWPFIFCDKVTTRFIISLTKE